MKTLFASLSLSFLLVTPLMAQDNAEESAVEQYDYYEYKQPVAVKRVNPSYPKEYAMRAQEGWALLNYVVDSDGDVVEVVVLDSSGHKGFEREAKKAVKRWKFEPAVKDGEKIQACHNLVQMDFSMGTGGNGITRKFRSNYNKFSELLEEGTAQDLLEFLSKVEKKGTWNLFESALLATMYADYYAEIKDEPSRYEALIRAYRTIGERGSDALKDNIAAKLIISGANVGDFVYPKEVFDSRFANTEKQGVDHLASIIAYLDEQQEQAMEIYKMSKISELGNSYHALTRNHFSIVDDEEVIDTLEVRCDKKYTKMPVHNRSVVSVPESWGSCGLTVYGEENGRFVIAEYKQDPTKATEESAGK